MSIPRLRSVPALRSVNGRWRRLAAVIMQEPKVAAFVGLSRLLVKQLAVSTSERGFRLLPLSASPHKFVFWHLQLQLTAGGVESNQVSILNERQGAADEGFR